mmetsp:Transcript_24305/g.55464  ORF Transcript_24305/g.55464 Transcript_24305/m.55464 type:complete len:449 (-) Transcript_24305:92-1438(-)
MAAWPIEAALVLPASAAALQYLRFAKKPTVICPLLPCCKLSERYVWPFAWTGFLLECASVAVLPLSVAYPVNFSVLLLLCCCREAKHPSGSRCGGGFNCLVAIATLALLFALPPAKRYGGITTPTQSRDILARVLSVESAQIFVGIGGAAIVLHVFGAKVLPSPLLAAAVPPALLFGLAAACLKTSCVLAVHLATTGVVDNTAAALAVMVLLYILVRFSQSGLAARARELSDLFSTLTAYGLTSSLVATAVGAAVFGEFDGCQVNHAGAYVALTLCYVWGSYKSASRLQSTKYHKVSEEEPVEEVKKSESTGKHRLASGAQVVSGSSTQQKPKVKEPVIPKRAAGGDPFDDLGDLELGDDPPQLVSQARKPDPFAVTQPPPASFEAEFGDMSAFDAPAADFEADFGATPNGGTVAAGSLDVGEDLFASGVWADGGDEEDLLTQVQDIE